MQRLAQIHQTYCPTNPVIIEIMDEPWNNIAAYLDNWNFNNAYLMNYFPSGTNVLPHYNAAGTASSYTTTGTTMGEAFVANAATNVSFYCVMTAHLQYVMDQEIQALGGTAGLVKVGYGGQWGGGEMGSEVEAILQLDLPQHYALTGAYGRPV